MQRVTLKSPITHRALEEVHQLQHQNVMASESAMLLASQLKLL